MTRNKPNPLQKLVRGAIREYINKVNASQPKKSKTKQANRKKSKLNTKKKRSRYISSTVRFAVLTRDNNRCVACGLTSRETQLQVDHKIPFSKGGSNDIDNLQTLCIDCNRGKSDRLWG